MQGLDTCDIWIWAEPKGTTIIWCGIEAVSCHIARYRAGEIKEVQHIFRDLTVTRLISSGIVRPATIWVETLNTGGEVDLGHREKEFRFASDGPALYTLQTP